MERVRRVQYWTALALLRGVMSSPAAGVEMLNARLGSSDLGVGNGEEADANPVQDIEFGFEGDFAPMQVVERHTWSDYQRKQLRDFARQLDGLANLRDDQKLASAEMVIDDWLGQGLSPVVFCRYIATANYVGQGLAGLKRRFPRLELQIITSELPDELRRQRIDQMGEAPLRVLVATDCLSEGINFQQHFTAMLHYNLLWNPNRLEQRATRATVIRTRQGRHQDHPAALPLPQRHRRAPQQPADRGRRDAALGLARHAE